VAATKNYYTVLGVPRDADDTILKTAYRKLARLYHPDKNPGDKASEERFKEVTEAYGILSDPDKRAHYDRFGTALHNWREAVGFAPGQRMQWSYSLNDRSSLGMGMANSRELEDQRQLSVYGRYSLTQDWALSAETLSRDPSGLLQLRDLRIGVQRRF